MSRDDVARLGAREPDGEAHACLDRMLIPLGYAIISTKVAIIAGTRCCDRSLAEWALRRRGYDAERTVSEALRDGLVVEVGPYLVEVPR